MICIDDIVYSYVVFVIMIDHSSLMDTQGVSYYYIVQYVAT